MPPQGMQRAWPGYGCPRCGSPHVRQPGFTWWGGLIGPKILSHTICASCGLGFNGKTGKSNNTAIAIYMGVAVALVLMVFGFVAFAGAMN